MIHGRKFIDQLALDSGAGYIKLQSVKLRKFVDAVLLCFRAKLNDSWICTGYCVKPEAIKAFLENGEDFLRGNALFFNALHIAFQPDFAALFSHSAQIKPLFQPGKSICASVASIFQRIKAKTS